MFEVLGVPRRFSAARSPTRTIGRGGGPDGPVAVISYAFWQRRFGGAADAIGRSLTVERVPFTIVGVAPPQFFGVEVGRTFDVAMPDRHEHADSRRRACSSSARAGGCGSSCGSSPAKTVETATAALRAVTAADPCRDDAARLASGRTGGTT